MELYKHLFFLFMLCWTNCLTCESGATYVIHRNAGKTILLFITDLFLIKFVSGTISLVTQSFVPFAIIRL